MWTDGLSQGYFNFVDANNVQSVKNTVMILVWFNKISFYFCQNIILLIISTFSRLFTVQIGYILSRLWKNRFLFTVNTCLYFVNARIVDSNYIFLYWL